MSSDVATRDRVAVLCGWPGCPSRFVGGPKTAGWHRYTVAPDLTVTLCPFHAVEHLPTVVNEGGQYTAVCSCHAMLPCMRESAYAALRDWRAHAREINGPEDRATCSECLREFEALSTGLVRRHNALDRNRGRLLATLCPGAGLPSREPVRP